MSKAVLISIQPKWCELIASGKKTLEVRKTRPKLKTPFKCYIYCTVGGGAMLEMSKEHGKSEIMNGKVIGEFVCDQIEEFHEWRLNPCGRFQDYDEEELLSFLNRTCLSYEELQKYRENLTYIQPLYAWHISDMKIYDEPKELVEFRHCGENYHFNPVVKKPPQSWCYVEEPNGI